MTTQFADLSGWNTAPQAVNWQAYKAWSENGGQESLVALKASEGAGIIDPHYYAYRDGARKAGITSLIHYHFARPDIAGNTPAREAQFAIQAIGAIPAHDLIVLDYEVSASAATSQWALSWLETIAAHYGKLPGIYASSAYIAARLQESALSKYPLWLAAWNNTPNVRPPCPSPWKNYAYWQFTDNYQTPGIGSTDANIALIEGGTSLVTTNTTNKLTITLAGNYFMQESATSWRCKQNGVILHDGNLDFYCSLDEMHAQGDYYGLSVLGIPITNEANVPGLPGVTLQRFERGILAWDEAGKLARPVGVKRASYLYPVESLYKALDGLQATNKAQAGELDALKQQMMQAQNDNDALKAQNGQLETQNSQLQSQLTAATTQLHTAQQANETLQANYAALATEKAALEQQPDTATYQAFVRDVSGASAQLQAALARVSVPASPSTPTGGQS